MIGISVNLDLKLQLWIKLADDLATTAVCVSRLSAASFGRLWRKTLAAEGHTITRVMCVYGPEL